MDTSTHKRAFSVLRMILIHVLIDQENIPYESKAALYFVYIVFILSSDELTNICSIICRISQPFEV